MKKICFVSPFASPLLTGHGGGPGGAERQFYLFGRELARRGWRVSYITEESSFPDLAVEVTFPLFQADFSYMGGSNKKLLRCWASLSNALKKADSTYYVIKTPAHLMLPVGLFTRLMRRKLVFWAQTTFDSNLPLSATDGSCVRFMESWGLKMTDIVITQTVDQRKAILDKYKKLNVKPVRSICSSLNNLPVEDSSHSLDTPNDVDVLWAANASKNKVTVHNNWIASSLFQ